MRNRSFLNAGGLCVRHLVVALCAMLAVCVSAQGQACGDPGAGNCYVVHPTPACDNAACCTSVCAIDPFCCEIDWDQTCVDEATEICGQCGTAAAGSCFSANGNVGCDNSDCCAAICAIDPFCCNSNWDIACVNEANLYCVGCGGPGTGECGVANGSPSCNNPDCCSFVCEIDPFCCDTIWDQTCADEANMWCDSCGLPDNGNCYVPNGNPGCDDPNCCTTVCSLDPFCCSNEWDEQCAAEAASLCGQCGTPAAGSCFAANGNVGCDNAECCAAVCAFDPFCCNTFWDETCANEANNICASCGGAAAGDCFTENATPGCNNADCCGIVCILDPFCCSNVWDGVCADEAVEFCATCGNAENGNCYAPNGSIGCDQGECCATVCAFDPFCCDTEWDQLCADEAAELCGGCGTAAAGSCFAQHPTPGCDLGECCGTVCALDPFCCNTEWDSICVAEANLYCIDCKQDCVTSKTFAPPGDGIVDGADLAILLGDWGPCAGCCTDTVNSVTFLPPPDGVVDGADLAVLLGAWGEVNCP